jgi:hypothetical protein
MDLKIINGYKKRYKEKLEDASKTRRTGSQKKEKLLFFFPNIIEKQFPFNDLEVLKFLMSLLKLIPVPNNRPYPIFITFL